MSEPTRQLAVGDAILGTMPSLGSDGSVVVLDLTNRRVKFDTAGISGTFTFYTAASSGGTVDTLNTVTLVCGLVTAWTQASYTTYPGRWDFSINRNSGQYLTMGF